MQNKNIQSAAKALKVSPELLQALLEHMQVLSEEMQDSGAHDIKAVKIIVLDKDENWFMSQDEPNNDKMWADPFDDERGEFDGDDEEDDEDDDGGNVLAEVQ